jgi:hypothetical protein
MDVVDPIKHNGDDLLADAQLNLLFRRKQEMQGCIDRLAASPFLNIDDIEFRRVNTKPDIANKMRLIDNVNQPDYGIGQDGCSSEEDGENNWSWGADDNTWLHEGDSVSNSSSASLNDDLDFFDQPWGSSTSIYASISASEPGSPARDWQNSYVPGSDEWDRPQQQRHATNQVAFLMRRLEWKFPYAFRCNEKIVAHTEEAMHPYMEAADFLVEQVRRYRVQGFRRRRAAFRCSGKQTGRPSSNVDWSNITKDFDGRLAGRKMHKKSSLCRSS